MRSADGPEIGGAINEVPADEVGPDDVTDDDAIPGSPLAGQSIPESPADLIRRTAIAMSALSQSGLTYGENAYDLDRYRKLGKLAADLLAAVTDQPAASWQLELSKDAGYTTPKVDVRGALVDEQERVLLMRERTDGKWSLPGGWADPLDTPSVAAEREVLEETGYGAKAIKLVGVWDRDTQGHVPPMPFSIYKMFFLCEATGEVRPPDALETLEIGWFGLDDLPDLSLGRISARQLGRIVAHKRDLTLPTEFD
jgi:ADP-ribose pyrophosphatase YjhB (NUDIX family)